MCGKRLRIGLLLSVAFFSQCSPLPAEDVYEITETELTELERILSDQRGTIEEQRKTLNELSLTIDRQQNTLTTLSETTETQRTTISRLEQSFREYEIEARVKQWTIGGVSVGVGFGIGYLAAEIIGR